MSNDEQDLAHAVDMDEPEGRRTIRRAVGASAIGNMTEWFDYGVYAVTATYITDTFFPGGTEWTLATFAVSFLVRPIGGLVWGPLGDRYGRKRILAATILLMAFSTFAIGLVPSYASIGVAAPVLLVLLRMLQGFSTGGEYGGAATFMAEYAPDEKRGFLGSFLEFGTMFGFSLGTALVLLIQVVVPEQDMQNWGWRLPFLVAGPMGLIGLYLRSRLEDTPVFRELEDDDDTESAGMALRELVVQYHRPLLAMAGLVIALNVANYTLISYMPTYLEKQIGLASQTALVTMLVAQVLMTVVMPFSGRLSDRVGRKPMWFTSMLGLFVAAIPCYLLIGTGFAGAVVGFAILGLLYVLQLSTISATFPAMFPTHVRYAGFAITYNVATAAFGGTAPLFNEALVNATGNLLVPAFSMMAACVVGLVALRFVPETAGASLRGTDVPSAEPAGSTP